MATTKAREDIKADLKTLKEDLKTGAREETQRLKDKAAQAQAKLSEKSDEVRQQARGYYDTARVRAVRKDVARVQTVLNAKAAEAAK